MVSPCEHCGIREPITVVSLIAIPMSCSICKECLENDAQPYNLVRASVISCGGIEETSSWYLDLNVFIDNEYITLREALNRYPITKEEIESYDNRNR